MAGQRCLASETTNNSNSGGTSESVESVHAGGDSSSIDQVLFKEPTNLKTAEARPFEAEINKLMGLIINSVYKSNELFLRELISNAADALRKARILSLTDKRMLSSEYRINLKLDKKHGLLIIEDNGIGMTREELQENLGTIANSGTAKFIEKMKQEQAATGGDDLSLIGQFGLGFYSAFLVADRVTVISKSMDSEKQYIWDCPIATQQYTIVEDLDDGNKMERGTRIILHLKESELEYADEKRLEEVVKNHSRFIEFPIYLLEEKKKVEDEALSDAELKEAQEKFDKDMEKYKADLEKYEEELKKYEEEKKKLEEEGKELDDLNEPEKPVEPQLSTTKSVEKAYKEFQHLNNVKAIWTRDPREVKEDEYHSFYKSISGDSTNPLAYSHFKPEGEVEFRGLVFIPSNPGDNPLSKSSETPNNKISVYVRHVLITKELKDFVPEYMQFLVGLIESDDLPLDISRERIQENKNFKVE